MKSLTGFITVLSIPLVFLNMLGGIASGIWLAILGEWGAIGLGVAIFFVSTMLLSLAIAPSILLAAPAGHFAEKGNIFGLVCFGTLSSLYILALVTVWCCGILFLFVTNATPNSLIPRLILSYGVATGAWAYLSSKDKSFASTLTTFLAEIAYLVIMMLVIFSHITLLGAIKVFVGFMLIGLVTMISLSVMAQIEQKKYGKQELDIIDENTEK